MTDFLNKCWPERWLDMDARIDTRWDIAALIFGAFLIAATSPFWS